jgi:flagellar biosynthesis/type III secretory pathway protein FliH
MDYIDTDNILKKLQEFRPRCHGDKPEAIKLNPMDVRYLRSNPGFAAVLNGDEILGLRLVEDDSIKIGECVLLGMPRLKRW